MQIFFMGANGGPNNAGFPVIVLWGLLAVKALFVIFHALRSLVDTMLRARTAYGVTTTRVMIVMTTGPTGRVLSLNLETLADLTLTERGEMGGQILVGPDLPRPAAQFMAAQAGTMTTGMLRLDLAQDARLVYRLIRRVRRPVEVSF